MRRLVAAGLLPERAGQPVKAWAHISLADLLVMEGSSALLEEWIAGARAPWAAARAAASAGGSDGGAWLDGDAAQAFACDAAMTPVVTGEVNPAALEDLSGCACSSTGSARNSDADDTDGAAPTAPDRRPRRNRHRTPRGLGRPSSEPSSARLSTWSRVRAGWLVSCGASSSAPGSAGRACPWTSGSARTSRPAIRNAVILRDKHCRWTGGATSPPRRARSTTSGTRRTAARPASKTAFLCWYHHQVVIHRRGWTLVLNPDGTTTAWNQDKTKVLHSHSPPARAG